MKFSTKCPKKCLLHHFRLSLIVVAVCAFSYVAEAVPTPAPTAAPTAAPTQKPEPTPTPDPVPASLTLTIGKAKATVELARNEETRERGLMYRTDMDDNAGMLFVLPSAEKATFWMKNTKIPLSIAFIDKNGAILEIYDMKPEDETQTVSQSTQVVYALEMNLHWFELNGVKPGDKIAVSPVPWSMLTPR